MRLLEWTLIRCDRCPSKKDIWIQRQTCTRGEHHLKLKAEIRVILLQAKEHPQLPANGQKLGEASNPLPHSPLQEPILPTP